MSNKTAPEGHPDHCSLCRKRYAATVTVHEPTQEQREGRMVPDVTISIPIEKTEESKSEAMPNEDEEVELAELIRIARALPPMTPEQEREQTASFAYGQIALMREWHDAPPEKLEELRQLCRRIAGCKTNG